MCTNLAIERGPHFVWNYNHSNHPWLGTSQATAIAAAVVDDDLPEVKGSKLPPVAGRKKWSTEISMELLGGFFL